MVITSNYILHIGNPQIWHLPSESIQNSSTPNVTRLMTNLEQFGQKVFSYFVLCKFPI